MKNKNGSSTLLPQANTSLKRIPRNSCQCSMIRPTGLTFIVAFRRLIEQIMILRRFGDGCGFLQVCVAAGLWLGATFQEASQQLPSRQIKLPGRS
jgi:hypothetical protein